MTRPAAMSAAQPPPPRATRLGRLVVSLGLAAVVAACAGTPPPTTPPPTASVPATGAASAPPPTPAGSPGQSGVPGGLLPKLFPLPQGVVPAGGTIPIAPKTTRNAELGRPYRYTLDHCGVGSPIDFDGSVWDVIGAQNGQDAPVGEEQLGELINAGTGTMTLVDADHALFRTATGLIVGLRRHVGEKRYPGCA